jgi:hypothetical protein
MVSEPLKCMNPLAPGLARSGRQERCEEDLTAVSAVDLSGFPEVLAAQMVIDTALAGGNTDAYGRSISPAEFFGDLRALAALMRAVSRPDDFGDVPQETLDALRSEFAERESRVVARSELRLVGRSGREGPRIRPWRGVPRSSALMAGLMVRASRMLSAPSTEELSEAVSELSSHISSRLPSSFRQTIEGCHPSETLLNALTISEPPLARFSSVLGISAAVRDERSQRSSFSPENVPPMMFKDVYSEQFEPILPGTSPDFGRRFCSMALVRCCGRYSWTEAAAAIGYDREKTAAFANSVVGRINAAGMGEQFGEVLWALAHEMDTSSDLVNWPQRQRDLKAFDEIPLFEWSVLCRDAGVSRGQDGGKRTTAAAWLWSELASDDWRLAPGIGEVTPWTAEKMRRFVVKGLPTLERLLIRFGATLL